MTQDKLPIPSTPAYWKSLATVTSYAVISIAVLFLIACLGSEKMPPDNDMETMILFDLLVIPAAAWLHYKSKSEAPSE